VGEGSPRKTTDLNIAVIDLMRSRIDNKNEVLLVVFDVSAGNTI
jgi:hypothetical protein